MHSTWKRAGAPLDLAARSSLLRLFTPHRAPSTAHRAYATEPKARFDWRERAVDRPPLDPKSALSNKRVKRVRPIYTGLDSASPFYRAVQSYEAKFLPLLEAEQQEEENVFKERLSTWSLTRLKEEGYCLSDLSAHWLAGNRLGRPVASFRRGAGMPLSDSENRFMHGSQVLISRIDPLQEMSYRGSVVSRTDSYIHVSFSETFELEVGKWRLDLGYSEIGYARMKDAIGYYHLDPDVQEKTVVSADREIMLQGTHLRDILLHSFKDSTSDRTTMPSNGFGIFQDDMRIHSWARRYSRPNPLVVEGDPVLTNLNSTQIQAMAMMIGDRMSLVQGPPGTGKTRTIIETIKLLKQTFQVPQPILVCTYTNVAVDNLVEGFGKANLKPLRVAFGARVKDNLQQYTLDHQLDGHPLRPLVEKITKDIDALKLETSDLSSKLRDLESLSEDSRTKYKKNAMKSRLVTVQRRISVSSGKRYGMQQIILRDIVSRADVICTTSLTSACSALSVFDFPIVFIDEASMSTEPASLVPLMKGSRHVSLIGDHKQLPPVITSPEAREMGLGVSLFERLTHENIIPSIMLNVQYRMHPAISHFPSLEFYGQSVFDGTIDSMGAISSRLKPPTSQHLSSNTEGHLPSVIFLDHAGDESPKDRSRVNANEAHIIASVVEDLLLKNPELQGRDIGIIAPYVAQISLLVRLFNTNPQYQARFQEVLGDQRAMQVGEIEIKTVDGFEGREKEIIIFSTVRNNRGGSIGFLADQRRLNVGLTRAKRGLFVVGSISTLRASVVSKTGEGKERVGKGAESWRRYAEYLTQKGLVVNLVGSALHNALYGNFPAKVRNR